MWDSLGQQAILRSIGQTAARLSLEVQRARHAVPVSTDQRLRSRRGGIRLQGFVEQRFGIIGVWIIKHLGDHCRSPALGNS